MARTRRSKGYWSTDLTEVQHQILDIMRCTDAQLGILTAEVARKAGLSRTDYATARLRALAARGLVRRDEKEAQRWFAVPSSYTRMKPLSS